MSTPHESAASVAPAASGEPTTPGAVRSLVIAAVLAFDDDLEDTVAAIRGQAHEVQETVVIGDDPHVEAYAESAGLPHHPTLGDFVWSQTTDVEYVWVVHGDASPRPDALASLVAEAERNDASVVGSKIVDAADPERLESIGAATDIYGEPYSGLDEGEVDLEQYDVVREVAFVNGVSMLVRRDLLRGLRGIDERLPPVAGGLDLSQRARIAGGKVIVAPSAEALHEGRCGHEIGSWRETAGRMRAMLKVYRPVTLLWAIPVDLLVLLLDGLLRVFLGTPRRFGEAVASVGWNVRHLPSTLTARRSAQALRVVGDEELFRYQVSGSVRLRELGHDLFARWQKAVDEEGSLGGLAARLAGSAALAAGLSVLAVAVASRGLWFATPPVVGFSLPISDAPGEVLSAYAGGWNPSGLGGPQAVHPVAALSAGARWLLFGWAGTLQVLNLVSMVAGLFGFARILRRVGVSGPARYAAALVGMLGPAWLWLADRAYWPALVALAALPWAVEALIRPRASSTRGRLGAVGLTVVAFGVLGAASPPALLVPALVVPVVREPGSPLRPVVIRLGIGLAAGLAILGPYLASASFDTLVSGGLALPRDVSWWVWTIPVVASAIVVLTSPRRWSLAAGGLVLIGFGLAGAVTAPWEIAVASMLAVAAGLVLVAGAALAADPGAAAPAWARSAALAAGAVLVLTAVTAIPGGRGGFPADRWGDALDFAASLEETPGSSRVLLVGEPGALPGDERLGSGFAYRLVSGDGVTLDQAWLAPPRGGDRALAAALQDVGAGADLRPGEVLAPFAVRWVVVGDSVAFPERLVALDLVPKPLAPDVTVLENLAVTPRAVTDSGAVWEVSAGVAEGPADTGRARIADNAAPGWGPDPGEDGWAITVSASDGRAEYGKDSLGLALGIVAAAVMGGGLALALVGRVRT